MWVFLVVVGFLAFAVGVAWFALTVVRRRPIESFPGGAGLLALAIIGLIVLLIGLAARPGPAPETEEAAPAAESDPELRAELAEVRGQLESVQRELEAVGERLDEMEKNVSYLARTPMIIEANAIEANAVEAVELVSIADPVKARSNRAGDVVDYLVLRVANTSTSVAFPLAGSGARITYSDEAQAVGPIAFHEEIPEEDVDAWTARWIEGEGPNLGPGEEAEVTISLLGLSPRLTAGKAFVVEIELPGQSAMVLNLETPAEIEPVMELGVEDQGS